MSPNWANDRLMANHNDSSVRHGRVDQVASIDKHVDQPRRLHVFVLHVIPDGKEGFLAKNTVQSFLERQAEASDKEDQESRKTVNTPSIHLTSRCAPRPPMFAAMGTEAFAMGSGTMAMVVWNTIRRRIYLKAKLGCKGLARSLLLHDATRDSCRWLASAWTASINRCIAINMQWW